MGNEKVTKNGSVDEIGACDLSEALLQKKKMNWKKAYIPVCGDFCYRSLFWY